MLGKDKDFFKAARSLFKIPFREPENHRVFNNGILIRIKTGGEQKQEKVLRSLLFSSPLYLYCIRSSYKG